VAGAITSRKALGPGRSSMIAADAGAIASRKAVGATSVRAEVGVLGATKKPHGSGARLDLNAGF
jgi:hypothetical protein